MGLFNWIKRDSQMEERNYEQEARVQGWRPKDEFKGPEEKWTDAQTFVKKGEQITGIMKKRLDRQDQQISELRNANKEFGEYQKQLREKDKAAAERTIAELEARRAEAITAGDGQEFTRIDREIQQNRDSLVQEPVPQQIDPMAQAWLSDNDWYNTNQKLRIFADGLADVVVNEGFSGPAYYAELSRRVKSEFPADFSNPRQSGANGVEEGGETKTSNSKAHTYENLDAEAKSACDRFAANGLMTKEDFVKTYEWET